METWLQWWHQGILSMSMPTRSCITFEVSCHKHILLRFYRNILTKWEYADFAGPLPEKGLEALISLEKLTLIENNFTGPLPESWTSFGNLTTLLLQGNQLSGPLPAIWGNSTSFGTLNILNLSRNAFEGIILLPCNLNLIPCRCSGKGISLLSVQPLYRRCRIFNLTPSAILLQRKCR